MSPGRRGGPALKHETATDEVPATVATILALTSGASQASARTREQVETLVMRVRATAMSMTVAASRDDRRVRDGAEGPDGWTWANSRFTAALDELRAVALGLVVAVEHGGAVDVEPRARGLQRRTQARKIECRCEACGRRFRSSGTAASHAAASRHVVAVSYSTIFVFEPAELPS